MEEQTEEQIVTEGIKYENKKCDGKPLYVLTPKDKYFLGHVLFFLLGVCNFLPMTFFSAANNFWLHKFRNISDPTESAENRTFLQTHFASSSMAANTVFSVAFGIFNVTLGHRYKIKNRLIITLCIDVVIFILFTISVKVDTDDYQETFFIIVLIGLGILAAANTVNITATMNLYPRFPPIYMKTCLSGQGSAGIIGDILNILIVTCFSGDIVNATLLYFSFGTVAVATTLILSIVVTRTTFFQSCLESVPENTEKKMPGIKELMRIGYKIWYPLALILLFVTGYSSTHTAITALVVSEQNSSSWAIDYFSPVMTFLLSDGSLLIGRLIMSYAPFDIPDKLFLLVSVARTLVLVPFIWLCNAQPRKHLPVLFPHDYQYGIILAVFMITNGYIINKGALVVPRKVDQSEADVAYTLLGMGTNVFQSLTAPISLFIVNIL